MLVVSSNGNIVGAHPRIIGLAAPFDYRKGGMAYEFIVIGRDEVGTLSKLNTIMNKHQTRLATGAGYTLPEPGRFVWTGYADYSASSFTVEDTLEEIRKLDFVERAVASKVGDIIYEQFLFPVRVPSGQRALILRVTPFVKVEQGLKRLFGVGGMSIFFNQGKEYEMEVLEQVRGVVPLALPEVLLRNVEAGLRTAGFGMFEFDTGRLPEDGMVVVKVKDPIFADIPGATESYFINGITCGAIEAIFGKRMEVAGSEYDGSSRTLRLVLRRTR